MVFASGGIEAPVNEYTPQPGMIMANRNAISNTKVFLMDRMLINRQEKEQPVQLSKLQKKQRSQMF